MTHFEAGQVIERREVLQGELWLTSPVTVVHDDGDCLAVRLDPGSTFTFPSHPFGVHPWAMHSEWRGATVLQLFRSGDLYSVWKFFDLDGSFRHWYVNFEAPVKRGPAYIDTDDYGLDLVVDASGQRRWKDVSDLHHQRTEGRISARPSSTFSPRRRTSKRHWSGMSTGGLPGPTGLPVSSSGRAPRRR